MTISVVLADDQRIVREGLALVLGLLPDIELLGAAEDGQQAIDLTARLQPDVVLMDIRMPTLDGIDATRRIRTTHPAVQVIMLTTYADDASVHAALQAGARGYLTKDAGADEIARAIASVHRGDALLDPSVQARLLDRIASDPPPARDIPDHLTDREIDVLRLIAQGRSNDEVATALHITTATVKTHINHIFAKIGARDRAQAVAYAYRTGIAQDDGPASYLRRS